MEGVLAAAACLCAAGSGFCFWRVWDARSQKVRARQALAAQEGRDAGSVAADQGLKGLKERAVSYAERLSHGMELGAVRCLLPRAPAVPERFARLAALAGLKGEVSYGGWREARLRLAALGFAAGAAAGSLAAFELAVLLSLAGAAAGWRLLPGAFRARAAWRADDLEKRLPEMLDVLALGMRSGLSFDGALGLYERYFDTALSRAFAAAQRQWKSGLARRSEALQAIAATYDSFLFRRVVDNIVRSLRFGTSLSGSLEDVAREARADYKARRQEEVAKAPIKMMVPTGALMLPAMLILVLGPVLLELAGNL